MRMRQMSFTHLGGPWDGQEETRTVDDHVENIVISQVVSSEDGPYTLMHKFEPRVNHLGKAYLVYRGCKS
jgi:hypothetical protein